MAVFFLRTLRMWRLREVNYLGSLVMLVGHAFYHVGVCDCTLRNHGYKGFL